MMALCFDLATEKDGRMPIQPERRERALLELIKKRHKPIALFDVLRRFVRGWDNFQILYRRIQGGSKRR
jgi:hypothetical protein